MPSRFFIKKWFLNIAIMVVAAMSSAAISAAPATTLLMDPPGDPVHLGTTSLFIPQNFDDNDDVVIVVDTELPSSCYELLEPQSQVDLNNKVISVTAIGRRNNRLCLPVMTPTSSVVNIGTLPQGEYTIVTNNGWLTDKLPVKEAPTSGPDDHRYADVKQVWIDYAPEHKGVHLLDGEYRYTAVIEARRHFTCEVLDRFEVIDSGRTLELLPIMKLQGDVECKEIDEVFHARALLPELSEGRYLLHVRSTDGQSVNRVVSTRDAKATP